MSSGDTRDRGVPDEVDRIDIKIMCIDPDFVEVGISAGNGRFAGSVEAYAAQDVVGTIAAAFRGFPASPEDYRKLEVGTFDLTQAGGGARFELTAGDGCVRVNLQAGATTRAPAGGEGVRLAFRIEPSSIDRFVEELDTMEMAVGSTAHLVQEWYFPTTG